MSGFIDEADRNQGTLLPEHVDEYVSDENPVRVIDAFIGELDLAKLGFEGRNQSRQVARDITRRGCSRSTCMGI
jgi:transposase